MGKKKIDKLKLIESKLQRNVAFCKRKRGFLKKAIELSSLCDQQILIVIFDKDRNRLVQFSSDSEFQFQAAYKAYRDIKVSSKANQDNYEKFTNDDYENLEKLDFRSVRYKKKDRYGDNHEVISEFEEVNLHDKSQALNDAQSEGIEEQSETQKSNPGTQSLQQAIKQSPISQLKLVNTISAAVISPNLDESSALKQVVNKKQTRQQFVPPQQQQPHEQKSSRKREQKQQAKNPMQPYLAGIQQNGITEESKKICLRNDNAFPILSTKQANNIPNVLRNVPTQISPLVSPSPQSQLYDQIHEQKIDAANELQAKIVQSQSKVNSSSSINYVDGKTPKNEIIEMQSKTVTDPILAALKIGQPQNQTNQTLIQKVLSQKTINQPTQQNLAVVHQETAQAVMKIFNPLETQSKFQVLQDELIENQILDILGSCDDIQNIKIPESLLQKLSNTGGLESYLKNIISKQATLKKELESKEKKSNEAYQAQSNQHSGQKLVPMQQQTFTNINQMQQSLPSQNQQSIAAHFINNHQVIDPMQVAIKKCMQSGGVNASYVVSMLQSQQDEAKNNQLLKQMLAQQSQQQIHNNIQNDAAPKIITERDIEMHKLRLQQQCNATINATLNPQPASKELFDEQSIRSLTQKPKFSQPMIPPGRQVLSYQQPQPVNQVDQNLNQWPSMQLIPPSRMALRKIREIQRTIMQPILPQTINHLPPGTRNLQPSTMDNQQNGPIRTSRANSCVFKPHQIKSESQLIQRPLPKKVRENYSVMSNLSHTKKNDLVNSQVHANKGFLYQDAGAQSVSHMSGLVQVPNEPAQSVKEPSKQYLNKI